MTVRRHVFFFGDSFASGYSDTLEGGWVSRLCTSEKYHGIENVQFHNLSIEGETTDSLAARWQDEMTKRTNPGDVCCIVLCAGSSDMQLDDNGAVNLTIGESLACIKNILVKALCRATVLWLGPVPLAIRGRDAGKSSNIRLAVLNAAYAEMANSFGVPYLNSFPFLQTFSFWHKFTSDKAENYASAHGYYAELMANWDPWRDWVDPANPATRRRNRLKKFDPKIEQVNSNNNPYLRNSYYYQAIA